MDAELKAYLEEHFGRLSRQIAAASGNTVSSPPSSRSEGRLEAKLRHLEQRLDYMYRRLTDLDRRATSADNRITREGEQADRRLAEIRDSLADLRSQVREGVASTSDSGEPAGSLLRPLD